MAGEDAQGLAARERQRAHAAYLDKRIPELHAEGKPQGRLPADRGARIATARKNTEASAYPGRAARTQADREWAEIRGGG